MFGKLPTAERKVATCNALSKALKKRGASAAKAGSARTSCMKHWTPGKVDAGRARKLKKSATAGCPKVDVVIAKGDPNRGGVVYKTFKAHSCSPQHDGVALVKYTGKGVKGRHHRRGRR